MELLELEKLGLLEPFLNDFLSRFQTARLIWTEVADRCDRGALYLILETNSIYFAQPNDFSKFSATSCCDFSDFGSSRKYEIS